MDCLPKIWPLSRASLAVVERWPLWRSSPVLVEVRLCKQNSQDKNDLSFVFTFLLLGYKLKLLRLPKIRFFYGKKSSCHPHMSH